MYKYKFSYYNTATCEESVLSDAFNVISYYSIDFRPFEVSINSWLAFIWLGISSSYLAFFFWYGGLSYGGVARVSQLLLLQPAFNLFLSYILLNDPLTAVNLVFSLVFVRELG